MADDGQEVLRPFGHRGDLGGQCVCGGTGDLLARLKGTTKVYAFKCYCPMGRRSKKAFEPFPGEAAGYEIVND